MQVCMLKTVEIIPCLRCNNSNLCIGPLNNKINCEFCSSIGMLVLSLRTCSDLLFILHKLEQSILVVVVIMDAYHNGVIIYG
jgi:hypothetical protein